MTETLIAGSIFLLTYVIIVSERIHRTIAALLGGFLVILLGIVDQVEAFQAIDLNVIFLLVGMMMVANMLSETGLFQWLAIQAVKLGRRKPFRILILLALLTAILSAALDNVTVVVLIAPVTLYVANNLRVSAIPFLIAEVLASNIGGTATLIGDPPNILIGSAAGIDFVTFAANMIPPVVMTLLLFVPLSYLSFRKDLQPEAEGGRPRVSGLETDQLITDQPLLIKCLIVVAGILLGFILHPVLHVEPATIAMFGAAVLMVWSGKEPHHILREIEWTTLFFFIGLFITIEAIVKVGIIEAVAQQALALTRGNLPLVTTLILWMSILVSGVVDNIPYATTMIPLIKSLGAGGLPIEPLWWSLVLGADFGGNLTLVGASANIVVASLAERRGYKISFGLFFRHSILITLSSALVSTVYLWLRYL